jgi:WD40 repeat protein
VFVWASDTAEFIALKRLPKGSRQVCAIGFSCDDKYLAACDMSDNVLVHIFDLTKEGENPVQDYKINAVVTHLAWNPHESNTFATVGQSHMMLCSFNGSKVTGSKGEMGGKPES